MYSKVFNYEGALMLELALVELTEPSWMYPIHLPATPVVQSLGVFHISTFLLFVVESDVRITFLHSFRTIARSNVPGIMMV